MTLAELKARTSSRSDDLGVTSYTEADIVTALNEGLRLFALLTLCIERKAIVKLQSDTPFYEMIVLLEDWLLPLRVRCHVLSTPPSPSLWDGPLWDEVTFDELFPDAELVMSRVNPGRLCDVMALNPAWETERSATVKRYGCLGLDLLFVHPAPSTPGTSLEFTYAAQPATLIEDSDVPEIPLKYHQSLIHYAAATLPYRFGGAEMLSVKDDFEKFLDSATECGDWVRQRTRTQRYDRQPFELRAFDRSRLIEETTQKKKRAA